MSRSTIRAALALGALGAVALPLAAPAGATPGGAPSVTLSVSSAANPNVFTQVQIRHFLRFQPYDLASPTLQVACTSVVTRDALTHVVSGLPVNSAVNKQGRDTVALWGTGCNPGQYPIVVTEASGTFTSFNVTMTITHAVGP